MIPEPIFDLAHLGHMELLTPKPEASLKFRTSTRSRPSSSMSGNPAATAWKSRTPARG